MDAEPGKAGRGGAEVVFDGLFEFWSTPSLVDLRFPLVKALLMAAPIPPERRMLLLRLEVGLSTGSVVADVAEMVGRRPSVPVVGNRCSPTTGEVCGRSGRSRSCAGEATSNPADGCVGEDCVVA